jgi:hypothetical protein
MLSRLNGHSFRCQPASPSFHAAESPPPGAAQSSGHVVERRSVKVRRQNGRYPCDRFDELAAVKRSLTLLLFCAGVQAQQIPLQWRTGTLTRVASGQGYLGTYSAASATYGQQQGFSIPIVRSDQVYVITGGGMEYVVTETGRAPAHMIVNASILYALNGAQFYFGDQEGRQHQARIVRQTLLDPGAGVMAQPTVWRSATGAEHYYVQRSADAFYAELLLDRQHTAPIKYEAKWAGTQYVGQVHWTEGRCSLSGEIDIDASADRIEGYYSFPVAGAKLDRKRCRYDEMRPFRLVWIPE